MRVLLFHIPDYVYTIIIILYHTRVSVRTSVQVLVCTAREVDVGMPMAEWSVKNVMIKYR